MKLEDELISVLQSLDKYGLQEIFISPENFEFISSEEKNLKTEKLLCHSKPTTECANVEEKITRNEIFPKISENLLSKKERWIQLRDQVMNCEDLKKHVRPGKKLVYGVGNLDAKIFFCGEAPGADEEIQGEPFVGRAGQLLTKMIRAMGLSREEVYIGNIMNWRPEMDTEVGNRPPTQEEMEFCLPYLLQQIEIVQPKAIVALGATAVNGLLGVDRNRRMSDIRGKWQSFSGIPLMVTFHPSYVLRNNTNRTKRLVWEDLLSVMESVGMEISEKQRNFFLDQYENYSIKRN